MPPATKRPAACLGEEPVAQQKQAATPTERITALGQALTSLGVNPDDYDPGTLQTAAPADRVAKISGDAALKLRNFEPLLQ